MRTAFRVGMLLLLLIGLLPGMSVHAQGGDSGVIDYHQAEVVFPSVVRFYLKMRTTLDAVSSISLDLTQNDQTLFSGAIDLDTYLLSPTPFVEILYELPINAEAPLVLFSPIHYRWTVTLTDGLLYEAEGDGIFAPSARDWRQGGEPPLLLSVLDADLNINAALRAVAPVYDLMAENTGLQPEFRWAVLPRDYAFCTEIEDDDGNRLIVVQAFDGTLYPCSEASAERIFSENGYRVLRRQGLPGLIPFENALIDDMFAVFYEEYWAGQDVPGWFWGGLAQYYHVTPDPLALRQMQEASRLENVFDADALNVMPDDPDDRLRWEQQAYTMVLYLADSYGADAPFSLAADLLDEGFSRAFSRLTGGSQDAFLAEWERWLFSDGAERAVTWTIYQPITATPSPTRTPTLTPIPPTMTPTPTATATSAPSATPTPTGRVLQGPSPLPTFTPYTAVPPTPSNTPRPPGSLDEQPAGGTGSGGICPSVLPSFLFPAAALFAIQRRKKRS